jgi:hypothetical protein
MPCVGFTAIFAGFGKRTKMGSIFIEIYLKETHLKIMNFA